MIGIRRMRPQWFAAGNPENHQARRIVPSWRDADRLPPAARRRAPGFTWDAYRRRVAAQLDRWLSP
jgi:hypothetical protein